MGIIVGMENKINGVYCFNFFANAEFSYEGTE
jgi:hypothetical protein